MRLVSGSWPLLRAIVSLSMMTKSTPTKSVTSNESTAPALICSTSAYQLAQAPGRRREGARGRAPEKMPERNSYEDGNDEGPTGERMNRLLKVITDGLVAGEQRPGLKGHEQKNGADECRHQERKEVASIENHRRAVAPSTSAGTRWIAATKAAGVSTPWKRSPSTTATQLAWRISICEKASYRVRSAGTVASKGRARSLTRPSPSMRLPSSSPTGRPSRSRTTSRIHFPSSRLRASANDSSGWTMGGRSSKLRSMG